VDLVGLEQLRERRRLAGHGLVVARLTLDEGSRALLEPPEFLVRGFVPAEEEEYYAPAASAVQSLLAEAPEDLLADEDTLKDAVRRCLQRHFSRALEKRPLIVPLLIWR
ncbi:MAG: ribonuclease J, partial [Deltaproteobacteria bacterium]|nr:ribonuclease J [Deltaproteobacteria bacterium]